MSEHLKGIAITALGVLFVVPDSLFVRLIDAEPFAIAFWRALTAGGLIAAGVLMLRGASGFGAVLRTGRAGAIYTFLIGLSAPGFVVAVSLTSVANVVFIFASIPVFAAIFSRLFLGEAISGRMILTMLAVGAGLGVIAYGSHGNEVASWQGDLVALMVSICFAGALTAVRRVRATSMIPAIPIGYLLAACLMFIVSDPFAAWSSQWPLLLAHGGFIAISTSLLTLGPRFISSPEVSLLILLESVLAPLLVWAIVGEDPGPWALSGGALVIGALLVSNLVAMRAHDRRRTVS
ncbi:DMT family transporter [Roseovarius spongiae]|uniref:DMT family transporter n=1 Tax=Roseovarius spongiae TaxID=2320272 RepID=A0A3A8B8L9_9RHOB|nr:DMT family transporter [Roseovarius spongiae]RKF13998.1 DMT family transporter [Roseovarius spongiae]